MARPFPSRSRALPDRHPRLLALPDPARRVWIDPTYRREALEAAAAAARRGGAEELVAAFDTAIAAGLAALGFPRAGVERVHVADVGRGWRGRKHPSCVLELDLFVIEQDLRLGQSDVVFSTWVHESVHGRAPFAGPFEAGRRGYEEGLVEGITEHVVGGLAGVELGSPGYTYYVAAYRALAVTVGVEAESLWHELWHHPTGRVRWALPGVVAAVTGRAAGRLLTMADHLFADRRATWSPNPTELARSWAVVLR